MNVLWLLVATKDAMKLESSHIFLFAKEGSQYPTMTSGWQGAPYFRIYSQEMVFKTGDIVKEKLGGLPWNDSPVL